MGQQVHSGFAFSYFLKKKNQIETVFSGDNTPVGWHLRTQIWLWLCTIYHITQQINHCKMKLMSDVIFLSMAISVAHVLIRSISPTLPGTPNVFRILPCAAVLVFREKKW